MNDYHPCYDDLINHLLDKMPMPERFPDLLIPHLTPPITYYENTLVLDMGTVANMAYWPVNGYTRSYVKYKPEEDREYYKQKTVDISLPGQIDLPVNSYMNQEGAEYFMEIAKGSTMVGFSYASFMELYKDMPEVALLALKIVSAAEAHWLVKMDICKVTCKSGYRRFLGYFGEEVVDYVDQQHIASYIGTTSEELSRIKKGD